MRLSDTITGLFLVGLGGISAYAGSRLPPVPGQQIGPNVFPLVIGIGLVLCGAMITLRIGRRFEDEAEAELVAIEGPPPLETQTHHPLYGLRVLIPPALLIFYVMAVDRLGFIPTAATIAFAMSLALRAPLKLAAGVALLAPIGAHLIFAKLLRVPLPAGLLPMPW